MWLIILSDQLPVVGLVGRYPANYLMGRGLIRRRKVSEEVLCFSRATLVAWSYLALAQVSLGYSSPGGRLPTCYSPVRRSTNDPKTVLARDLHVLGTPPAFVLSQDQTLRKNSGASNRLRPKASTADVILQRNL